MCAPVWRMIAADALDILELLVDILTPASRRADAKKKAWLW